MAAAAEASKDPDILRGGHDAANLADLGLQVRHTPTFVVPSFYCCPVACFAAARFGRAAGLDAGARGRRGCSPVPGWLYASCCALSALEAVPPHPRTPPWHLLAPGRPVRAARMTRMCPWRTSDALLAPPAAAAGAAPVRRWRCSCTAAAPHGGRPPTSSRPLGSRHVPPAFLMPIPFCTCAHVL
jgi:hypothetical protein